MKQLVVLITETIHYQIKMAALKKNMKLKDWVAVAFLEYLKSEKNSDAKN